MRSILLFLLGWLCCASNVYADVASTTATHAMTSKAPENAHIKPLIGRWDVVYEIYDKNGKLRTYHGQVTYQWILDGGALQEIWTSDSHNKVPQPYATTIDFRDAKRQCWSSTWIYPAQGATLSLCGIEMDGHMVFTGHDEKGSMQRWTINDIQAANAFDSHFEVSDDAGKTWRRVGVNHLRRHRA